MSDLVTAAPQDTTTATYVFAVSRTVDPSVLAGLPGMEEGAPVHVLPCGRLTAVVQAVTAAHFTEEAWQARLSDPAELERCARAHHAVVSAAATCGPTVPLPLATLYRGDSRVRQAMADEADRFTSVLDRIAGHVEWGVKVYAAPAPSGPEPDVAGADRAVKGAGLAYLNRKRGLQQRRHHRHEEALRAAEAVDAELRELAAASRRLRPHGQEATGRRRVQVLNAAYLVAEGSAAELTELTGLLEARTGAEIEISGPWVPYSFVGGV